jgi:hypothetical protein
MQSHNFQFEVEFTGILNLVVGGANYIVKKQKQIMNVFPTPLNDVSLSNWFNNELQVIPKAEADVLKTISQDLQDFVVFPMQGLLFFDKLVRLAPKIGQHSYPEGTIFSKLNPKGKMETMTNGPAVVAF